MDSSGAFLRNPSVKCPSITSSVPSAPAPNSPGPPGRQPRESNRAGTGRNHQPRHVRSRLRTRRWPLRHASSAAGATHENAAELAQAVEHQTMGGRGEPRAPIPLELPAQRERIRHVDDEIVATVITHRVCLCTTSPSPRSREPARLRDPDRSAARIACRFDDAFFRVAIGNRSVGSRKSTYVQEITFPASSTWCPSARY